MDKRMVELKRLFREFTNMPFPKGSADSELNKIHADLVQYDSRIAGCISTILSGDQVPAQHLRDEVGLSNRLDQVLTNKQEPKALLEAKSYHSYLWHLKRLASLARQVNEQLGKRHEAGHYGEVNTTSLSLREISRKKQRTQLSKDFQRAIENLAQIPFPASPPDKKLETVHDQLAQWTQDVLSDLLTGHVLTRNRLTFARKLENQLKVLTNNQHSPTATRARVYLEYLERFQVPLKSISSTH